MNKQESMELVITKFIKLLYPPRFLFDVGVGVKSEGRTLKMHYPKLRMIGVEPLAGILPLPNFPGEVIGAAITSSTEPKITINYNPDQTLNASVIRHPQHTHSIAVPTMTLDELDRQCKFPRRCILWMDIEGSELDALRSGPRLLESGRVRWINLEERREGCETPGWCSGKEIAELLAKYGYEKACEYNRHERHHDAIYIHRGELAR